MKELLEHIIKSIVNYPDDISIDERESVDFPGLTILTIDVNENDKGVIIGRKGRTINSIRDIITISAIRNNKRVRVILKDDRAPEQENKKIEEQDMLEDEI
ncbi:MAG: KH domain-containing protein [Candidatus Dojkabacteria bacterium]|uniref:RNA-binding protein KhpA n=1 Tax=Candidatus Dojkabacteria bacterium TaxID=2099670 RepID=A0A847ETX3_9BACT|nr:KH domain-containing protein [Candidatus Dojkabacteria bacterium]NLE31028.1 KH domain-containing protein [Candidatus Dojkabacteria bacterium]